jgi:hypothetical protein
MDLVSAGIQLAGVVQLLIAAANLFAVRMFDYRDSMRRMSPIVREVFVVQNVYIVLTVVTFAFLCFFFPADLAGASRLGRCLAGFLCVFWILRVVIQVAVYDREVKRQYSFLNGLFLLAFIYLGGIFGIAALGPMR